MRKLAVIAFGVAVLSTTIAHGQVRPGPNSSLLRYEDLSPSVQSYNPLTPKLIPPRRIQVYDIIAIRVDELARMQSEGEIQRRKNSSFNAAILDWITFNGFRSVKPAAQRDGDPRVQAQLDELLRAENAQESTERLTFNIAARVADVRPNGTIVLEARKTIRNNDDTWMMMLTGLCRQQDIGPDNVVLSRNIVDLSIEKREMGERQRGIKPGWLLKIYDKLRPF